MRLWVLSDLHLEINVAASMPPAPADYDALIIAGDFHSPIVEGIALLEEAAKKDPALAGRPIVMVAGNREHYRQHYQRNMTDGVKAAADSPLDIRFLDGSSTVIEKGGESVRFIGATLWTDYALYGDVDMAKWRAGRQMNDHRLIRYSGSGTFTPDHAARLHRGDRASIEEQLEAPWSGKTVVVTHHLPSPRSLDPRYEGDALNPAFASDLGHLIRESQPAMWIHGHIHSSHDYRIGETRIVCNPMGYMHFGKVENLSFKPDFVVTV